jgi:hypothetical protein
MDKKIAGMINGLKKRNIEGIYCQDKAAALSELLKIIPQDKSIGRSGSQTLDEIGIIPALIKRENQVFNQYEQGLSRERSLEIRNQGANADVFLSSANAITVNGEMVFFSAYGHRIAGIANAKNVIIVCGINKIVADISKGIERARNYATPLNCKRLRFNSVCLQDGTCHNEICLFPEYKRMCCQIMIIEAEAAPGRLKVILVGENLGF